MLLQTELKQIVIKHQKNLNRALGIPRDFKLKLTPKYAIIISGIRRCGKSTLAKQFLKNEKAIYHINFEDIALAEFKLEDFTTLENVFRELIGKKGVFFFDEIQNILGWEKYIRQLVDAGEKIIITGSNASMLSKELGTRLTGRQITKELFPFSYKEYLLLKKKKHSLKEFENYLQKGGFPEYLKLNDTEILINLFQDIFYRDVLQRNELRNETAIKSLLYYLLSNIGKEISFNKLKELIKVGSVNTVSQFINHFEQAYLLFQIKKYDPSLKKQLVNPKKIYCVDSGIININAFAFSENKGRILENTVFLELKRRNKEIFYHKNKYECDFLVHEKLMITQAIQVCCELNSQNKEKEIKGIVEAMIIYNLNEGYILTLNQEEELNIENKKILVKPVWKFLTGKK